MIADLAHRTHRAPAAAAATVAATAAGVKRADVTPEGRWSRCSPAPLACGARYEGRFAA